MSGNVTSGKCSYEDAVEIISESEILEQINIGHSFVYKLEHATHGSMVVVNSFTRDSAIVRI